MLNIKPYLLNSFSSIVRNRISFGFRIKHIFLKQQTASIPVWSSTRTTVYCFVREMISCLRFFFGERGDKI